ncbi:MAG TPA: TIM barrel protein [Planctomycetota bacterium]|nr:TIM barrel protein [Planctomycetota bacterium]
MSDSMDQTRRDAIKAAAVGVLGALGAGTVRAEEKGPAKIKGNIKQSVCRWCYGKIPLDQFAAEVKRMGFKSIDLLTPDEFLKIKATGLTCAMVTGISSIEKCLNRKEEHERCEATARKLIDFAAAEGLPSVICFSGNRKGMPDDEGLENCATGIKRFIAYAEEKKVNIVMELLNSRVNHPDYMCDHTDWGVKLCKKVGSERFKLLYDIYHMQIMEGNVIETIKANKDYIAHYHTGGVPGRAEIDETQELNYPAIMKAILETGYQGYVAQEFIPKRDPLVSLEQSFKICDV